MAERFNNIFGIFGQRGSGKTEFLKGNAALKIRGIINLYQNRNPPIKVLIIDTFDHPSYRDIPILPIEKLEQWKGGIYRCFTKPHDIPKLNRILTDSQSIWNSLIVYEDSYKHTSRNVDRSLINLIADSKQKNIDICFMYHAFGQAPPDLYRYLDFIALFKTKDSPLCRKNHMPGYFDKAIQAYNEVKKNSFPFYHQIIDTGL